MFVQESMLKPGSGQHNAGAYAWILWDLSLTGGRTGPQTRLGSPEVERDRRQPDSKLWPVTSWARLQSGQISYRRHFPLCFKKKKSHGLVPSMSANCWVNNGCDKREMISVDDESDGQSGFYSPNKNRKEKAQSHTKKTTLYIKLTTVSQGRVK